MARGRLDSPNLDDRTWQEIVDQARELIPTYAPEWTDHNPSDLGMTLIELFAWMVEGLTYRLNRVPEKHLLEFLNLVGITRDPATPASTWLTWQIDANLPSLVIPKGTQAATPQTETEDAIVYETDSELIAMPINLQKVLLLTQSANSGPVYRDVTGFLTEVPLSGLVEEIPPNNLITLVLGFNAPSERALPFHVRLNESVEPSRTQVIWSHSVDTGHPISWPEVSQQNQADQTDGLTRDGSVSITVPPSWSSQSPDEWPWQPVTRADHVEQPLFWLALRISNLDEGRTITLGLEHLLFNSVLATNALTITDPELIGTGDGTAFQTFALREQPLYKDVTASDPYGHLQIEIREPQVGGTFGSWMPLSRVEDFPAGDRFHYRLNPVTGEINFGNFDPAANEGNGRIPSIGSELRALTYRYVASDARGNVPGGTIKVIRSTQSGLVTVFNPGQATGGSNEENVEETKRRGPEALRNRYRAVTLEDYEYLAREATTDVKKVRALPSRLHTSAPNVGAPWTYGDILRAPGSVHVIVIPDAPVDVKYPAPSRELIHEVMDYLDERRTVGTTLQVTYPRYLPINAQVDLQVWSSAITNGLVRSVNEVAETVRTQIDAFLHPIHGGPDGEGWAVGQDVTISTLFEVIQPPSEIGFITNITIEAGRPLYVSGAGAVFPAHRPFPIENPGVWVQLVDYEMVCSGTHTITAIQVNG